MNQEPYTPPPADSDQPAYGAPPQPPKSKKTLIIVLIIVGLLLCCCTTGAGIVAFGYFADQESGTVLDEPAVIDLDESTVVDLDDTDETPLDEWYSWDPTIGDHFLDPPTPRQQAIAEQVIADLYPDFTLLDAYVDVGGWNEERQMYEMDLYNVHAYLTTDPTVEIARYFWAWTEEGTDSDSYTIEDTVGEGNTLGTLDDGTGYVYPLSDAAIHDVLSAEIRDLLITVAEKWPAAVIAYVGYVDGDSTEVDVSLTTWDTYYTTEDFEGVRATYSLQDGEWTLDSYEWTLPD